MTDSKKKNKRSIRDLAPQVTRLLALVRPHKKALTGGLVFLAVGSAAGLAYPQAIRIIVDNKEMDLDTAVMGLMALSIVQAVAIACRHYIFTSVGEKVVATLRTRVYRHILGQEIGFFDTHRTGELANRLSSDTGVIQNTVSVNISMTLRALVGALGAAGMLVVTSPALAGIMLLVVPAIAVGAVIVGRQIRKASRRMQDALAGAGEVAEETISGIRTVRAFTQESNEIKRYGGAIDNSYEQARKRAKVASIFSGGVSLATFAAIALIVWFGGRSVQSGNLTEGQFASFLMYTVMVAVSFGQLAGLWGDLMRAVGSAERVFELLDREPKIPTTGGQKLTKVAGEIRFEDVTFAYPSREDVTVLDNINLTIAPGEVVALVGPSGGGKSTIASLIPRFYDPDKGTISVDGQDLRNLEALSLREAIGSVAQEPTLMATSITENIRYGRSTASDEEVQAAARVANAHEFIEGFPEGYDTMVGERGVQLSGGQKQRVAIARAVLKDPSILILDEATSALDAESEHLVQEALDRLMKDRTTLIIAHRLSTVLGANRVLVIDDGHIVQAGSHDELMSKDDSLYRRLVERQFLQA